MKWIPILVFVLSSTWFVYSKTKIVDSYVTNSGTVWKWETSMLISLPFMVVSIAWNIINILKWIGID